MVVRAIRMAYDYALRMFWSPRSFPKVISWVVTRKPTTCPTSCSYHGMNKLSVYMNFYGLKLGGLMA